MAKPNPCPHTVMGAYRTEFPGFALDVEIPAGFVDQSWHHDACPSWLATAATLDPDFGRYGAALYVDHADKSMREIASARRFTLFRTDSEGSLDGVTLIETDCWEAVLGYIQHFAARAPFAQRG